MCGRFTLSAGLPEVIHELDIEEVEGEWTPRYNIAPMQEVPVVVLDEAHRRLLTSRRWGLVVPWADDPTGGSRLINARAETLTERRSFRDAFARRRCLVVADGFYEWASGVDRQPHYFHLQPRRPFAFAGLWERWESGDGLETCTIVTTDANELVAPIHDRMPAMLAVEGAARWLAPEAKPDELAALLRPRSPMGMVCHAVSKRVNSPSRDTPECIAPVATQQRL